MRRLLQSTTAEAAPLRGAELAPVSYPQLRAALEARAVLEVGADLAASEPRRGAARHGRRPLRTPARR